MGTLEAMMAFGFMAVAALLAFAALFVQNHYINKKKIDPRDVDIHHLSPTKGHLENYHDVGHKNLASYVKNLSKE
jgi:hypothetical protein